MNIGTHFRCGPMDVKCPRCYGVAFRLRDGEIVVSGASLNDPSLWERLDGEHMIEGTQIECFVCHAHLTGHELNRAVFARIDLIDRRMPNA